jgi:mannosyl-3-phosphoglycerate synthase
MLPYAAGYAVEPNELLAIFEGFGGILPILQPTVAKYGIDIQQIETRNPHFHEEKGIDHLYKEMLLPGLSAIFHSPLCINSCRESIIKELADLRIIKEGEEPISPRVYQTLRSVDIHRFREIMSEHLDSYSAMTND